MIIFLICLAFCARASAQLNGSCIVSVLNRDVQVNADGTWVLPNIPANFGPVRARATCVTNGVTQFGQSAFFSISSNGSVDVPPIVLGSTTSIPTAINITAATTTLTQVGLGVQLSTSATYADGTVTDVTKATAGTQYTVSNPAIATVTVDGLVTAVSSGTVVVQAVNEGRQGITSIQVLIAGAAHGGIPDSWAIANGLDPNDPAMPFEDPDHDGLTNLQEFQNGTDPHNPDTDGDGLTDGQEVLMYHTNPLLFSSDATGISDGIEVQTGTLGGSLGSKLAAALRSMEVQPSNFVLTFNTIQGSASRQLKVLGHLIDGKTTLDLTSTQEGTNYISSDLTICNFGSPDGNVFAGSNGSCTITASNNGFTAQSAGVVQTFSPTPLSFVAIPGFANSVDVNGNFAYIAAGSAGLQVVNVSDRSSPAVVASVALPGNADDVRLLGNRAYVAAGSAGLQIVDITNPLAPAKLGSISTAGTALDIAVRGTTAYVANGSSLLLADVTNPAAPTQISALPLTGLIQGVDVDTKRNLAVVAAGTTGIYVVDISNPAAPAILGSVVTGDARDVAIRGNYALVADFSNSATSVDITNPSAPVVVSHILDPNLGGFLQDLTLSGNFALGADVKFVNGIPITDISNPTSLLARAILNFPQRDDNGMGIAADGTYVYLVTEHSSLTKFGSSGDSRLYIGQYQVGNTSVAPPTAVITAPAPGSTALQGSILPIAVNAQDDVAVAAVNFLVNGQVVFTATSAPYQFNFTVPTGVTSLTLGATVVDLAGNIGIAPNVAINVIPAPVTTATGTVVDQNNNPLSGATVTCFSLSGKSGENGVFSVVGLPIDQGNIQCSAIFTTTSGTTLAGESAGVSPVPGGNTTLGTIVLQPAGRLIVAQYATGQAVVLTTVPLAVQSTVAVPCPVFQCPNFGKGTINVAVSPDGTTAAVAYFSNSFVSFLNLKSQPPTGAGSVSVFAPIGLAFTADGKFVLTTSSTGSKTVTAIDVNTQAATSLNLPVNAEGVTVTPSNEILVNTFLLGSSVNSPITTLSISQAGTLTQTGSTTSGGGGALTVTISPDGRTALVANLNSNNLGVLGIASDGTVTSEGVILAGFSSPQSIAFLPNGKGAAVLSCDNGVANSSQVAILNIDNTGSVTDFGVRIPIGSIPCNFGVNQIVALPNSLQYAVHTSVGVTLIDVMTHQTNSIALPGNDSTVGGLAVIP